MPFDGLFGVLELSLIRNLHTHTHQGALNAMQNSISLEVCYRNFIENKNNAEITTGHKKAANRKIQLRIERLRQVEKREGNRKWNEVKDKMYRLLIGIPLDTGYMPFNRIAFVTLFISFFPQRWHGLSCLLGFSFPRYFFYSRISLDFSSLNDKTNATRTQNRLSGHCMWINFSYVHTLHAYSQFFFSHNADIFYSWTTMVCILVQRLQTSQTMWIHVICFLFPSLIILRRAFVSYCVSYKMRFVSFLCSLCFSLSS